MSLDDKQYNTLLNTIKKNIPSDCSAYDAINKASKNTHQTLSSKKFSLSDYEAYRNNIEFVNSFYEQIIIDERKYFEGKYGKKVYNFLKKQREAYLKENKIDEDAIVCKKCPPGPDGCNVGCVVKPPEGEGDEESGGVVVNKSKDDFMSYLMSINPIPNTDILYKKIEYRNEEHEWLSTINNWLTFLYFALLLVLFSLLAVSGKLFLRERFILYLFLVVLPFAFPYLFEILKYLFGYLFPNVSTHGPKNAFLEVKTDLIDSYNV